MAPAVRYVERWRKWCVPKDLDTDLGKPCTAGKITNCGGIEHCYGKSDCEAKCNKMYSCDAYVKQRASFAKYGEPIGDKGVTSFNVTECSPDIHKMDTYSSTYIKVKGNNINNSFVILATIVAYLKYSVLGYCIINFVPFTTLS